MNNSSSAPLHLAQNIRALRVQRGLAQVQLAKLCGIPRSTLANLESGSANPTLAVLSQVSGALGVNLEELLSPPAATFQLYPRGSLPEVSKGRKPGTLVHKLLPHNTPGMEIDRIALDADDSFVGRPHRPGTQEYLYCEKGKIRLRVAGETFVVAAGDVATFPGDQRHSYENAGRGRAVAFGVVALRPLNVR